MLVHLNVSCETTYVITFHGVPIKRDTIVLLHLVEQKLRYVPEEGVGRKDIAFYVYVTRLYCCFRRRLRRRYETRGESACTIGNTL